MSSLVLKTLTSKREVDAVIRDTSEEVLLLRFSRSSDPSCLRILSKSVRELSKFALVDIDSGEIQIYVKYFDITFTPSIMFFFSAQHMKMDSRQYRQVP